MTNTKKLALFAITWPLFVESALQMSMRTADTFMVSNVSDAAVAAVGVSNQLMIFVFLLLQVISAGSAITISQYLGANRLDAVRRFAACALLLNFIFGLVLSAVMVVFSKPLLSLFGLQQDLLGIAQMFLSIVGAAIFIQALNLTMSAIVQVHGFTRYTMMVAIGMNLVNLIGNYLVIFEPWGFPKYGVMGVAVSAIISQCLGLIVYIVIMYKVVRLNIGVKEILRSKLEDMKKILSIGIPTGGNQLAYSASQLLTTYFITSLGTEMLSTRIYTQNIMYLIMALAISLGRGTQIIIGRLVGAGEKEAAYKQMFRSLRLSLMLSLVSVTMIVVFRHQLIGLFTSDVQIIALGAALLAMGFILEPGRCLNIIIGEALRATGDARFILITGVVVIWGLIIPLTYFLGIYLGYGLVGIWIAFIIDEWLRGIVLFIRWRSRAWEKKVLVQPEAKGGN
ncbi:MATE family efflux transporter [Paenibacillus agricola]|uniref:MATE family efflux transporter n=1 Tax=Paenibacillus agricola TaxID=2716264 RepID=A0ABX0J754_9BACL|nr:MATE family efflux transporter [Paenibacillus agricola]NHN31793.1 MATE family efflux transporter [Paenibacillus agricola]